MALVDIVVKVGGGLLAHAGQFDTVLAVVDGAARKQRLLIVPGGGPFADAVREIDRRLQLTDDAAHWMAIQGMDQYAHLLADRLPGAVIITDPSEIPVEGSVPGADGAKLPILAPYRWLHAADPLPHSWDVTSDSIAAWVAGQTGAARLVLVKPPGAVAGDRVDAYFARALPAGVRVAVVAADQSEALASALRGISRT